jgi:sulfur carrier protein ThiS
MRVHLGGHLSWYDPQKRSWIERSRAAPIVLHDLLAQLGVPPAEVSIVAVNGRLAALDDVVAGDDRVEFYPPMGGGLF